MTGASSQIMHATPRPSKELAEIMTYWSRPAGQTKTEPRVLRPVDRGGGYGDLRRTNTGPRVTGCPQEETSIQKMSQERTCPLSFPFAAYFRSSGYAILNSLKNSGRSSNQVSPAVRVRLTVKYESDLESKRAVTRSIILIGP